MSRRTPPSRVHATAMRAIYAGQVWNIIGGPDRDGYWQMERMEGDRLQQVFFVLGGEFIVLLAIEHP